MERTRQRRRPTGACRDARRGPDAVVALAGGAGLHAGDVGACVRLRDGDGGQHLAGDDAGHPAVERFLVAIAGQVRAGHVAMDADAGGEPAAKAWNRPARL